MCGVPEFDRGASLHFLAGFIVALARSRLHGMKRLRDKRGNEEKKSWKKVNMPNNETVGERGSGAALMQDPERNTWKQAPGTVGHASPVSGMCGIARSQGCCSELRSRTDDGGASLTKTEVLDI